ncbi:MAG: asparaginase [Lachnospiraceae bacterium]|nr:asparaginase [Lachnospiraceae bacterium]
MTDRYWNIDIPSIDKPGTVVVLATGGTIAGVGETGKSTVYASGQISGDDLVAAIPEIRNVANVETVQVCNINSDDITDAHWIRMAKLINVLARKENVAGFVITHGTDTMEETAYFLNLTVKTVKPVVLTGSMRPATAFSADGPMNLYQSICVASNPISCGRGVLMVFSDNVYSARSVVKSSSYSMTAMSGGTIGAIGIVRDGEVYYYETTAKTHTVNTEFDVIGIDALPKVSVVFFHADADVGMLEYAVQHSDGVVLAGAGAGEFSLAYKAVIEKLTVPLVVSTRIEDGIITQKSLMCPNTVAANNLQPQKAAVLLRLALTITKDHDELVRIFSTY